MDDEPKQPNKEKLTERNLLTNFDQTVELMRQIEGNAWYKNYIDDAKSMVEHLKELADSDLGPDDVAGSIYGDGGVTRWMVMVNGEIRFSALHDTGDGRKIKTKKAEALGFKLFE